MAKEIVFRGGTTKAKFAFSSWIEGEGYLLIELCKNFLTSLRN